MPDARGACSEVGVPARPGFGTFVDDNNIGAARVGGGEGGG